MEIGGPHLRVDEVVLGDTVSVVHGVRPPHHEVGAEGTVGAPGAETTATSGGPESNREVVNDDNVKSDANYLQF